LILEQKNTSAITPVPEEAACSTLGDRVFALESVKDIRELRPALQWS
jgi:hypothetical protein